MKAFLETVNTLKTFLHSNLNYSHLVNTFLTHRADGKIPTWRFTFVQMPLSLFGHLKQLNNLAKLEQVSLMLFCMLLIT